MKGAVALLHSPGRQIYGSSASWSTGLTWWANKYLAYQYVNGYATNMIDEQQPRNPYFWLSPEKEVDVCVTLLLLTCAQRKTLILGLF